MPRRQPPLHDADDVSPSGRSSFSNFQFTFNLSASDSGKNSFIEPDPDAEDIDSESLTDSVQAFPEEYGRTYHAYRAGSYSFPNDELEIERLELQNEALVKLFGGRLFFAPLSRINPPRMILDIATGTGDWAIKMGDIFSSSKIIATDLSPIQPACVPPNVSFYVEDSGETWDYSHKFDYIHTRVTAGCWHSFKDQVVQQAFDALTPGGYLESQEFDAYVACDDGTLTADMPISRWFDDLRMASELSDRPVVVGRIAKQAYAEVGFVEVQERIFKMPLNGWPKDERLKELGRMWERNFLNGLSGFSVSLFNRMFGRTPAEIEVSLVDVRRDSTDTRIHAYLPVYVVTGRKPFPGEGPIPTVNLV